jgi:2-methylaconitate cis-trans-isomerase PrpF
MRAGTSRGPFFLRDWLPQETSRDETLIGAICLGPAAARWRGRGRMTSVASCRARTARMRRRLPVPRSGGRSVDTRELRQHALECLFAIEQGLIDAKDGDDCAGVQRQHQVAH